jgi:hypothetical protein
MTAAVLTDARAGDRIPRVSPKRMARVAGLFYLLTIASAFGEVVRTRLVVHGDAAATAHNILASETLYRWGFAAGLIGLASYVVVTILLYELLKPVNPRVSLIAAAFSLIGIAAQTVGALYYLAPLLILHGPQYLSAFDTNQLQAMSMLSLTMFSRVFQIGLVFFGLYCSVLGYLIFESTFMPKTIGVLMLIAGVGYLVNSFLAFVAPDLWTRLPDFVYVTGLGEIALTVWLLAVGVNERRWHELALRSAIVTVAV